MCQRTRAKQKGAVAIGAAATKRVHRAFEDAGNGHGVERGGAKNGGAREGKLVYVRQRCRKRQYLSQRRIKKRRQCNKIRHNTQPARMKSQGWMQEEAVQQKVMQVRDGATRGNATTSQQTEASRNREAS